MVFRLEFLCTYLHITVASGSQLASGSNLRCSHESPSQSGIAIFWRGLPCLAPVSRNVGQVRCVGSNVSRRTFRMSFERYAATRVTEARLRRARVLMACHATLLVRVERQFGVPSRC